jgi:hypothetical protein
MHPFQREHPKNKAPKPGVGCRRSVRRAVFVRTFPKTKLFFVGIDLLGQHTG